MEKKEHLLIHDKLACSVMLAVFCISFFVIISVIRLQTKQNAAMIQKEKEHYISNYIFQYQTIDQEEINAKLQVEKLKLTQGNVIIIFSTVVGNGYSSAPVHIVASYNEPLTEELEKGRFPTENEIAHGRKCVVIGEGLLRFAEQKEKGREITIDGVSYEILGVLKDVTGDGTDNRVIVFHNCFAEKTMKGLNGENWFIIEYGSNQGELNQVGELQAWLYQFAPPEHFVKINQKDADDLNDARTIEEMMRYYNKYVLYVLFAFCMGACFVVSSVWVKRRRKELVIRMAFGSSFRRVVGVLLKDIGIMMGLSLLINIVLFTIQGVITGEQWIDQSYLVHDLLYLILAGLIVIAVTLIQPLRLVATISPAEGTRAL